MRDTGRPFPRFGWENGADRGAGAGPFGMGFCFNDNLEKKYVL